MKSAGGGLGWPGGLLQQTDTGMTEGLQLQQSLKENPGCWRMPWFTNYLTEVLVNLLVTQEGKAGLGCVQPGRGTADQD